LLQKQKYHGGSSKQEHLELPWCDAKAASTYYLIASSFLVRETMWWWLALARKQLCWWLASFGKSYHGDVLQYAKQYFLSGFRK